MIALEAGLRGRCHRFTTAVMMAIAAMLFTSFAGAYLMRRSGSDWIHVPLPSLFWLSTGVMAGSSLALESARWGNRAVMRAALALGSAFPVIQSLAFFQLLRAGSLDMRYPHAAFLIVLCITHALHVLGGLAFLAVAARRHLLWGPAAAWWHFVGMAWLFLFALMGAL